MRIWYKCLVPIYVLPEMKLRSTVTSKLIIMFCLPISTFMYLWAIYIFPWSVCLCCCSQIVRLIPGIYQLLTDIQYECRNWELGLAVSFLDIYKSDFRYSVRHQQHKPYYYLQATHLHAYELWYKCNTRHTFQHAIHLHCSGDTSPTLSLLYMPWNPYWRHVRYNLAS